jgi:hypothetical protein
VGQISVERVENAVRAAGTNTDTDALARVRKAKGKSTAGKRAATVKTKAARNGKATQ